MSDDRLRELTPIVIDFFEGERPTDQKLEGMMTQVDNAFSAVESIFGDLLGDSGIETLYTTNLGRDLGSREKGNPLLEPDVDVSNYVQALQQGRTEHELDLVPVGTGVTMLVATTDASVSLGPSSFKSSESDLLEPGDWTIRPGRVENGRQKNSRKLITHSPSTGGAITFTQVTSGRGSAYEGAKHNVIPTKAQAEAGGPFCSVAVADAVENIYSVTLPVFNQQYNEVGDSSDATISNTVASLASGRQHELASYFFDSSGLDMLSNDGQTGDPKFFPLNSIRIYDWDSGTEVEGIEWIQASSNPSARRFQFDVKYRSDVSLDTSSGRYMVVNSGTTVYEMLQAVQRDLYNHKHDGDDMIRTVPHSALMDLRTSSSNTGDRSAWYGASNINNNDHSMYFHRDGFTDTDIGGGGNVIRGTVVVGSQVTGPSSDHENYNLIADSHAVAFGRINNGGNIYFDKQRTHNLPEGRGNIPQNFSDTALVVTGSRDDTTQLLKTIYASGNLRVEKDVVLGTTKDDDVLVSGDLYVHQSITLTPKNQTQISSIAPETGKTVYSATENAPVFFNGTDWVNSSSTGFSATVGDGSNSQGKFNGTNAATIQSAIDDAETKGGGRVLIQRGNYNLGGVKVTIPAGVKVLGDGANTVINQDAGFIAFEFEPGSSHSSLANVKIIGGASGVTSHGAFHDLEDIILQNCDVGLSVASDTSYLSVDRSVRFVSCAKDLVNNTNNSTNNFAGENGLGFHNGFYFIDPANKQGSLYKFRRTSGTGELIFEDSSDSAMGRGRFKITGIGTWVVDEYLAILPPMGIGGQASIKGSSSGGQMSLGAWCYDSDFSSLGNNGGFVANSTPLTTGWALHYDFARDEASSGVDKLKVGTRFIKPFIQVSSNPGEIFIDGFNIIPMNFSSIGLYL